MGEAGKSTRTKAPGFFHPDWRAAVTEGMSQWTVLAPLQPFHQLSGAPGIFTQQHWLQGLWKVFAWTAKVALEGKLNAL